MDKMSLFNLKPYQFFFLFCLIGKSGSDSKTACICVSQWKHLYLLSVVAVQV